MRGAKPQKTISFPFTGGMTPTQTHLHFNTHKKPLWVLLFAHSTGIHFHTVLTDHTQSLPYCERSELLLLIYLSDEKRRHEFDLILGQITHCERGL